VTEQAIPQIHALRDALTAAATLGTDRRPFRPPQASGALGAALMQIDPAIGSERALLSAAAAVTSYQRAGYLAPQAPETAVVQPAAEEDRSICSSVATQHLHTMLGGNHRSVLPEWLSLLAASGKRVPVHLLPDLLEAGKNAAELRALIRAVVGIRGQWLAAQNLDWHYASVATATTGSSSLERAGEVWETGTRAMRLALLEEMRLAAPDAARDLIMSAWASEKADDRAAFLEKLGSHLRMDDEPFLEAALDDRSKEVRKTAAELLARLPDSRLVQRMIVRVTPLLRWTPPERKRLLGLVPGKSGSIDLTLPDTCDKAMARDGVDLKPFVNPQGLGERAQWLLQMLRTIPPTYWAERWQATPAEILAAAAQTEWSSLLMRAWTESAKLSHDSVWAEAILRLDPAHLALLTELSVEQQETLLLELLAASKGSPNRSVLGLLQSTRHIWSSELAHAALSVIHQQVMDRRGQLNYQIPSILNEFAYRMPPGLASLIEEISAIQRDAVQASHHWQISFDNVLSILHFRHEMHEALKEDRS
jgi:hypothetical protein